MAVTAESSVSKDVTTECLRVAALRERHGPNATLESWMADPAHLFVGRQGRVWITDPRTGTRRLFHYRASKWANPFKVGKKPGQYPLAASLRRYRDYVLRGPLVRDLPELCGQVLGCFCDQAVGCHALVLAELCRERGRPPPPPLAPPEAGRAPSEASRGGGEAPA
eukprot:EG_transcript_21389